MQKSCIANDYRTQSRYIINNKIWSETTLPLPLPLLLLLLLRTLQKIIISLCKVRCKCKVRPWFIVSRWKLSLFILLSIVYTCNKNIKIYSKVAVAPLFLFHGPPLNTHLTFVRETICGVYYFVSPLLPCLFVPPYSPDVFFFRYNANIIKQISLLVQDSGCLLYTS